MRPCPDSGQQETQAAGVAQRNHSHRSQPSQGVGVGASQPWTPPRPTPRSCPRPRTERTGKLRPRWRAVPGRLRAGAGVPTRWRTGPPPVPGSPPGRERNAHPGCGSTPARDREPRPAPAAGARSGRTDGRKDGRTQQTQPRGLPGSEPGGCVGHARPRPRPAPEVGGPPALPFPASLVLGRQLGEVGRAAVSPTVRARCPWDPGCCGVGVTLCGAAAPLPSLSGSRGAAGPDPQAARLQAWPGPGSSSSVLAGLGAQVPLHRAHTRGVGGLLPSVPQLLSPGPGGGGFRAERAFQASLICPPTCTQRG